MTSSLQVGSSKVRAYSSGSKVRISGENHHAKHHAGEQIHAPNNKHKVKEAFKEFKEGLENVITDALQIRIKSENSLLQQAR